MKADNLDNRIVWVICSVASKRAQISEWSKTYKIEEKRRISARRRRRIFMLSGAASILLILGVAIGYLVYHQPDSRTDLMSQGRVDVWDEKDAYAIAAMIDSNKYDDAIRAIDASLEDTILMAGIDTKSNETAVSELQTRQYELKWLKIDVFLKMGVKGKAIELLKEYKDESGPHQQEAKKLYNELTSQ